MIGLRAAALLAITSAVVAQEVLWVTVGPPSRKIGGGPIAGVGDVNQDGYEDLVHIVDDVTIGGWGFNGLLWLISGRDGSLIREVNSQGPYCRFGAVAAAGDVNQDGVADYLVTHGCPGSLGLGPATVQVRSGVDDTILTAIVPIMATVYELLGDVDLDGDGIPDVVMSSYYEKGYLGGMSAFRHDGTLLYARHGSLTGPTPLFLGNHLAKLGDVNGDGCEDFVMGCWDPSARGCGVVVDGRTGTWLRICYGELPGDGIGFHVTGMGDLDGDGVPDFAAGNGSTGTRKLVRAFSTATGQPLFQWTDPNYGYARSMAGRGVDLDGDGLGDIVIGDTSQVTSAPGQSLFGRVWAHSGRDGQVLHVIDTQPTQAGPSGTMGDYATVLQAPAGSNIGTIVVPNAWSSGCIVAYRGLPRTSVQIGAPCAGNLPSAPNVGMSSLGANGVRLHLSGAPSGGLAVLLLGLSTTSFHGVPLPAALDPLGLPGCTLQTSVELMQTAVAGTTGNEAGYAYADVGLPVPSSGAGAWTVSAQWLVLGDASTFPGGMSQAITWQPQ